MKYGHKGVRFIRAVEGERDFRELSKGQVQ